MKTPVSAWIYNVNQQPREKKFLNAAEAREWIKNQLKTDRIRTYTIERGDKQIAVYQARGRG